jgi:hypothetical protein
VLIAQKISAQLCDKHSVARKEVSVFQRGSEESFVVLAAGHIVYPSDALCRGCEW